MSETTVYKLYLYENINLSPIITIYNSLEDIKITEPYKLKEIQAITTKTINSKKTSVSMNKIIILREYKND
uniref:Uncharacterized protein n=1 Tax=viral metagenome TaxID=1070528 RepID=A0A6C0ADS4_9ZZZZ